MSFLQIASWNIEHLSGQPRADRRQSAYALCDHIEMAGIDVMALQEIYVTPADEEVRLAENQPVIQTRAHTDRRNSDLDIVCYLLEEDRLIFTGDHVMQGSTVVIAPPDGDMVAYLRSLELLLGIELDAIAPGHGHVISTPHDEVRKIIAHRLKREGKVLAAFSRRNPASLDELVPLVYDDVSPRLHPVARRSLHAHLLKLAAEKRVSESGDRWALSQ